MKIRGLSSSGFNTYSECQFRYWLIYELSFQDESGAAAVLGTIAHKVLEIISKGIVVGHDKKSKFMNAEWLWNASFNRYYDEVVACADIKD